MDPTQKPSIGDLQASIVFVAIKKELKEMVTGCEVIAGITMKFMLFNSTLMHLKQKDQLTPFARTKRLKDFQKLADSLKDKLQFDKVLQKIITISGRLAPLNRPDLSIAKQTRLNILRAKAEAIQTSMVDSRAAIASLSGKIVGMLTIEGQ